MLKCKTKKFLGVVNAGNDSNKFFTKKWASFNGAKMLKNNKTSSFFQKM